MSDNKSKIPDLKELAAMSGKLFSDIKTSVGQIIQDYKDLRAQSGIDGEEVNPEAPKARRQSKPEEEQK
jgi:hypothetical protein